MWVTLSSLQKARGNTSICSVHTHIFIFNGLPTTVQSSQANCIEFINLGSMDAKTLKAAKWEPIQVTNADFVGTSPRGSHYMNNNEIIIFGGSQNHTYAFDVSFVNSQEPASKKAPSIARIKKFPDSKLMAETNFCVNSDYIVRTFGNYLYAVDGDRGTLHVFSIKDQQWNFSKLEDLGIN